MWGVLLHKTITSGATDVDVLVLRAMCGL